MNLRNEIVYQANLTPNTYLSEIVRNLSRKGVQTTSEYVGKVLKDNGFLVRFGICYNPGEEYVKNKQYLDRKYWRIYKQDIIDKSRKKSD